MVQFTDSITELTLSQTRSGACVHVNLLWNPTFPNIELIISGYFIELLVLQFSRTLQKRIFFGD